MIAGDGNLDKPEIMAKAGAAFMEYTTYIKEIIAERRKEPKDDFVSILVNADDEGILGNFELSDEFREIGGVDTEAHKEVANAELIMLLVLLMVAGNETTRNAISGGMQALIENPDQRQRLLDDPSLLASATEEIVRYVSPVHSFGANRHRGHRTPRGEESRRDSRSS